MAVFSISHTPEDSYAERVVAAPVYRFGRTGQSSCVHTIYQRFWQRWWRKDADRKVALENRRSSFGDIKDSISAPPTNLVLLCQGHIFCVVMKTCDGSQIYCLAHKDPGRFPTFQLKVGIRNKERRQNVVEFDLFYVVPMKSKL